jgi:DNA polymerase I
MNPLIYGKSALPNIVSIEANDDKLVVFTESPVDGSVSQQVLPNKYWILASEQLERDWIRLKGDLHYKWGKQFTKRSEFARTRAIFKSRDIYSIYDPKEANMVNTGLTYFKGLKPEDVSIFSWDIETTSLEHNDSAKLLLISTTFRKQGKFTRRVFAYTDYANEGEMLLDFCSYVRELNPSIFLGYNIVIFDLPYIKFIADRAGVTLDFGRDGSPIEFSEYESELRKDGSQSYTYRKVKIYGREVVDMFFVAIKYDIGRKYEKYKLKYIVEFEGLEDANRQHYDAEKIRHNYKNPVEWEKIIRYAEGDADDSIKLFDLMIPSFFYITQSVPKSFQAVTESATGSQINAMMVRSYLQNKHSIPKASEVHDFEGAISDGFPGIYKNSLKVDVRSLYPSIMLEYKVFCKEKDPNAHFLNILQTFTDLRIKYKGLGKTDKHYDDLQNAFKVLINSMYGFMSAQGLQFNYPVGAAEVTRNGREILRKAIHWATGSTYENYCQTLETNRFKLVNLDTDSITFCYPDGRDISKEEQNNLLEEINSIYPTSISWEHDGFYPSILVVKAKNYVLKKSDGSVKIKGSALKATMKQKRLQDFIKETINLLLDNNKQGVVDLYHQYIKEILTLQDISGWCSKKTVTKSVLNPQRTNERKVLEALKEEEGVQEGDKIWVYFTESGSLKLLQNWSQDHDKFRMMESLWDTVMVFQTVIDKNLFIKYHLKTKRKHLDEL